MMRILTIALMTVVAGFFMMLIGPTVTAATVTDVIDTSSICFDADGNPRVGDNRPKICDSIDINQTATDNVLVGPDGLITKIVKAIAYISGSLAVIMIIIAGLRFIFSNGNPESTAAARNTAIYALVGLVVAVSAQLIVVFVLSKL